MNYMNIYNDLVKKYKDNPPNTLKEYCENHHIVPRSFGGGDDESNKVILPVRCHIFAHMLLFKHWKDLAWKTMDGETISKAGLMALSLDRLCNGTKVQKRSRVNFSSQLFAKAKEVGHETLKNMIWINNGTKNTMVDRRNPNAVPDGWKRGMANTEKRKKHYWATNGKKDLRIEVGKHPPKGFYKGRSGGKGALKMIWITNGSEDKYVEKTTKIPDGWRKGRNGIAGLNSRSKQSAKKYEYNGKMYTVPELASMFGYPKSTLIVLLSRGTSIETISSTPYVARRRYFDYK